MSQIITEALIKTLIMVFASTALSVILGFIPAILLTVTANDGLRPNKLIYGILDFIYFEYYSLPKFTWKAFL